MSKLPYHVQRIVRNITTGNLTRLCISVVTVYNTCDQADVSVFPFLSNID